LIPVSGILALSLILAACNNNGGGELNSGIDNPSATNLSPQPFSTPDSLSSSNIVTGVTGTVSDATISVIDGDGTPLFFGLGDERANYSVTLPPSTTYPVLVTATNGIDLVTGLSPVISMVSVIESPVNTTSNINPFTTLIVKTAQAMPGGLNSSNLDMATQNIVMGLSFGLDIVNMPDPIATPITAQNIASMIKAGRALTETIHRSVTAINLAGGFINEDELLSALAADMIDGSPDGIGAAGADPFLSAVVNVVSAQVMVESLGNNLQVDGLPVAVSMDSAIKTVIPTALSSVSDLVVSGEMLAHTKLVIHAAQSVTASDDTSLRAIISAIASLDADMLPVDIAPLLPANGSAAFNVAINSLVSTADSMVYQSVLSAFSGAHQHRLISLAWYPGVEVDGYIIHAGPTLSTATSKVSVIATASVELDAQTDLGLSPGDSVCFSVKAFNAAGVSGFSAPVCTVI